MSSEANKQLQMDFGSPETARLNRPDDITQDGQTIDDDERFDRLDRVSGPMAGSAYDIKHLLGYIDYDDSEPTDDGHIRRIVRSLGNLGVRGDAANGILEAIDQLGRAARYDELISGARTNPDIDDFWINERVADRGVCREMGIGRLEGAFGSRALQKLGINSPEDIKLAINEFESEYINSSVDTPEDADRKSRARNNLVKSLSPKTKRRY